jgi:hypothetical protein
MKGFNESLEQKPSFEDLVAVAREIKSKNLLPDVREVYIADSGKFNVRMHIQYTEEFYAKTEVKVRNSQNLYNQVRLIIVKQFDDFDSDSWNSTAIGKVLRKISELFSGYLNNLSNREPFDSAELYYLFKGLESFGELISTDDYKRNSKNEKLKSLNEGAERFLKQIEINALSSICSNIVQMILLVADRDDDVGVELKKIFSSPEMTALYPTLKQYVADN